MLDNLSQHHLIGLILFMWLIVLTLMALGTALRSLADGNDREFTVYLIAALFSLVFTTVLGRLLFT